MSGHIVVPNLQTLGDSAFHSCEMLSSVELGNSLERIGQKMFYNCNHLTNVTIGRGVQTIADNAFTGCTEIRLITSRAWNPPTIYSGTFADVDDGISVRVPCDYVSAYQNAPYWSHFQNIEGQFEFFFSATSGDITKGSVTIVQAPTCDNIEAHIQANPYHNFRFVQWSDGNTDNPRYMVVLQDTMITAEFESLNDINTLDGRGISVFTREGSIVVEGIEGIETTVYDMMGRRMNGERRAGSGVRVIPVPASGVYLVRIEGLPARKVVVIN